MCAPIRVEAAQKHMVLTHVFLGAEVSDTQQQVHLHEVQQQDSRVEHPQPPLLQESRLKGQSPVQHHTIQDEGRGHQRHAHSPYVALRKLIASKLADGGEEVRNLEG